VPSQSAGLHPLHTYRAASNTVLGIKPPTANNITTLSLTLTLDLTRNVTYITHQQPVGLRVVAAGPSFGVDCRSPAPEMIQAE